MSADEDPCRDPRDERDTGPSTQPASQHTTKKKGINIRKIACLCSGHGDSNFGVSFDETNTSSDCFSSMLCPVPCVNDLL